MAEISGPQSPHISSSSPTGEKVGSCAERQPLPRTPESPGSPFEMIANSPDFEFKDSATSKGLPYGPPKRDSSDKPAEAVSPLYFRHTHPGISVNEEQLFLNLDPILHFGRAAVPDSNSSWHSEQDNSATVDSHPKPVSGQAEAFLEPLPQGAQELCKRKMGGGDGTGQAAGSQAMTVEWGEGASSRSLERPYEAKAETRWPEADEEMDSSGESDDTVIDAGWRVKSSATERVQHTEESWGELGETQREEESGVPKRASEGACENPPVINESSSKAMVLTTGSPHCESFVDLAESCITEPFVRPDAASLEDKVQEYLTIEALRALADGAQAWDTESRESSPEVLNPLPQYGSSECITLSGWPNQEEILKDTDSTDETQTLKVRDLLSWRDMKKSGIVFGTVMVLLLSLAAFSIISVISYLVLALLSVTISYRVYKSVMQAVQKSEDGHPFKSLLEKDVTVSSDAFQKQVNASLAHVNRALKYSLRLFLVQDLIDSLKLAVLMWLMTYVGAVFNGITLLILGVLVAFTAPIVYEKYKVQIDRYVSLVQNQVKSITEKIQAKLPGALKKKSE